MMVVRNEKKLSSKIRVHKMVYWPCFSLLQGLYLVGRISIVYLLIIPVFAGGEINLK
jgi:hypothetical protein